MTLEHISNSPDFIEFVGEENILIGLNTKALNNANGNVLIGNNIHVADNNNFAILINGQIFHTKMSNEEKRIVQNVIERALENV